MKLLTFTLFFLAPVLGALAASDTASSQTKPLSPRRESPRSFKRIRDMANHVAHETDIGRRSTAFSTSQDGVDSAGFYYSLYNANNTGAGYTEFDDTGEFEIGWNLPEDTEFLGGKGYKDTNTRSLTWDGYFTATGDYTLAIYGWTLDPVTEWYIVETHGTGTPGNGNIIGTVSSDGGTYDVYDLYYSDVTPIYGVSSFHQYWSVRQVGRTTGTVNVTAHFEGWSSLGLEPGTPIFQMVTLEGFEGQGYLDFTVSS